MGEEIQGRHMKDGYKYQGYPKSKVQISVATRCTNMKTRMRTYSNHDLRVKRSHLHSYYCSVLFNVLVQNV